MEGYEVIEPFVERNPPFGGGGGGLREGDGDGEGGLFRKTCWD